MRQSFLIDIEAKEKIDNNVLQECLALGLGRLRSGEVEIISVSKKLNKLDVNENESAK